MAVIDRLIADGVSGLVSFGICGGLDPMLASGTLVLPHAVRGESGARYTVDRDWRGVVEASLPSDRIAVHSGDILGVEQIVDTPARKAVLYRETGAVAVDLESHLVAHAARKAGIPFLVIRAVADPAERSLPSAALVGLNPDGRTAVGPVLMSLARNPAQLPALLQVALDTRRALSTLRRAATLGIVGPADTKVK
jgi:hopanoid-associated phosphorylase